MSAFSDSREVVTVTIASGATLSDAAELRRKQIVGVVLPAAFAANTARLLFQVSVDGSNFYQLADADDEAYQLTVTTAPASRVRYIEPVSLLSAGSVKVGTYQSDASTAVNQDAEREIGLIVADVLEG